MRKTNLQKLFLLTEKNSKYFFNLEKQKHRSPKTYKSSKERGWHLRDGMSNKSLTKMRNFLKQICESKNTSPEDDRCVRMCLVASEMTKHQVRMASRSDFTASFEAALESIIIIIINFISIRIVNSTIVLVSPNTINKLRNQIYCNNYI